MMNNRFVAGVVAGLAISAVGRIYLLVRKDKMVGLFMQGGEGEPAMSASAAPWMLFGSMLFMGALPGDAGDADVHRRHRRPDADDGGEDRDELPVAIVFGVRPRCVTRRYGKCGECPVG